jgi:hypothetical protein
MHGLSGVMGHDTGPMEFRTFGQGEEGVRDRGPGENPISQGEEEDDDGYLDTAFAYSPSESAPSQAQSQSQPRPRRSGPGGCP